MTAPEDMAARARALVGVRFRPQGRSREHGLDCLGLVAVAANLPPKLVPRRYRIRSEVADDMLALDLDGRVAAIRPGEAGAGDILLVEAGARQHHFVVLLEDGFVHADAGHGRVVETPGPIHWPVVAAWRVVERI